MNTDVLQLTEQEIRKQYPAMEYRLVLMRNHEDKISIRNGETEQMLHATANSLAITLIMDGREGIYYTNKLTPDTIRQFVRQAAESTMLLEADKHRILPDPARYYQGDGPDLKNFDTTLQQIEPSRKLQIAQENNCEVASKDSRIISLQTMYTDRQHQAHYLSSNGFLGYEESSRCTLTTIVTMDGEDGQHPMDGWGETRIFFEQLPHHGIAETALQRTVRKIGQKPIASGRYRMILESPCAGQFLQPLLSALNGRMIDQRMSFLQGMLHQQVISPIVTLTDDPLIPGTAGACHFDYDGVATQQREIFRQGVLETYFIDTYYSQKLNMPPTTQGVHHLIMKPGARSLEQIIADTDCGILVTDFNGGNCDPNTGNFSYGIEGFLIEKGIITQPLSGMNITGKMTDVWNRVSEVGNDADPHESELIPSIVFEDICFGGKS